MNVVIVASKLNLNGAGSNISLHHLATRLAKRVDSLKVVTVNIEQSNNLSKDVLYEAHPISEPGRSNITKLYDLVSFLRSNEDCTDIYHFFSPIFLPIGGLYRKLGGTTPVAGRLNSYTMFCTNPNLMDGDCHQNCSISKKILHDNRASSTKIKSLHMYLYKHFSAEFLSSYVDVFFAISPQIANIYSDIGIDYDKIAVIPNFYDEDFHNEEQSAVKSDILYVGRLEPSKGVDILLKSLEQVGMDLKVSIIGDGSEMENLIELSKSMSKVVDIDFHGWIPYDQLSAYYRGATVFVHPGRWPEPFGRTILESMQCGTPPIVSDVGAPPWIINDKRLNFDRNNTDSLADTISSILSNEDLYNELTIQCEQRLEDFRPSYVVDEIVNLYNSETEC